MKGKQSKPRKALLPDANCVTKVDPLPDADRIRWCDHVAIRGSTAQCDRCGASEALKGFYDPTPIDPQEMPDQHAAQAAQRADFIAHVDQFLNQHKSCKKRVASAKASKLEQGGLF